MSSQSAEDLYGGFDDYEHAYDTRHIAQDPAFQQAVLRSSHGRRPTTSMAGRVPSVFGMAPNSTYGGASAYGTRDRIGRTSLATRNEPTRPMTAVRAAGYTSYAKKGALKIEQKCKEMEQNVMDMLKESLFASERKNFKEALEKAKEAGRRERAVVKYREQQSVVESMNIDLTFTVLFNLAQQYQSNDMANEALNTYQIIVKNKMFPNSGRLKVNIGNIFFKKKDYHKAIKYYRMALDQVPSIQKQIRISILNNIGVAFIKMGKYDDAMSTFEHCVDEQANFKTALNMVLTAYCLEDADRMRDGFQKLLDVPIDDDEDNKPNDKSDVLMTQMLNNDTLRQWTRRQRADAERAILTAAKTISPAIASDFALGYEWCVETIKQSVHASLAIELEMSKAGELLKRGDIEGATEVLKVFHTQESKIASAAANNLCMLKLLQGGSKLQEAEQYLEQSLSLDHYNANALVNAGNIAYLQGDFEKAYVNYREALNNDAGCVQALYNLGLVCRKQGNMEQALDFFYKLHNILLNNVQVLCQLASIYESLEDTAQAIELYSQANSLAPSDPSILERLAAIYDAEGDKTQAFQSNYDSYRYYPSNLRLIEWMGAYYIDAQFAEKAVNYFEKASIMQPNEIKWQLMMASSYRRAGNYQKALELYSSIHKKFPTNIECLKFLVRITSDLGMPEATEYMEKLGKAERVWQLKAQRESDSSQKSADLTYSFPVNSGATRPKTGQQRLKNDDSFEAFDDALLPQ
ncbi:tetratricopeptide repeat protein [Dictyocaulus viviparus]|uniref:Tetratricopeptide repeat protein n=1 Tax=Dictyocaulus viviparus TaxID=29172 RepID=A0A0D8XWV4_DICVI|nr:tetratricopeptide repeat protein [Dictyocaulus viviparus]